MKEISYEIVGISYKIMNLLTYSILSVVIKLSLSNIHSLQLVFLMNAAGLLLTTIILLSKKERITPHKISKTYMTRGLAFTLGIITWISALKIIPITEATAISYLTPIIAGLIGTTLFKEKFTKNTIISLFLSILGMVIILKPFQNNIMLEGVSLALLSAILWAIHDAIVKSQTLKDSWIEQSHIMFLIVSVLTLPMAIYVWQTVEPKYLICAAIVGILSVINKFFLINALSKTGLVILAPISFLRLVFTSAMAYMIFGETIDLYTVLGVMIIIYSTLIMVRSLKSKRFN